MLPVGHGVCLESSDGLESVTITTAKMFRRVHGETVHNEHIQPNVRSDPSFINSSFSTLREGFFSRFWHCCG